MVAETIWRWVLLLSWGFWMFFWPILATPTFSFSTVGTPPRPTTFMMLTGAARACMARLSGSIESRNHGESLKHFVYQIYVFKLQIVQNITTTYKKHHSTFPFQVILWLKIISRFLWMRRALHGRTAGAPRSTKPSVKNTRSPQCDCDKKLEHSIVVK